MENSSKRKIILVTDGDRVARKAVETASSNIGARCISRSAGNPTPLTGAEIVNLVKQAPYDPVVVMADDRGHTGQGKGEQAIVEIARSDEIDIIGVIAVASNTEGVNGIEVDYSISKNGNVVENTVDKCGNIQAGNVVKGDTVDILDSIKTNIIIGIGDPGKMDGKDKCEIGAPIITKAMEEILKRSGFM
ncbi:MAG: stage V sporulation protein AE [Bacillota bacterium]